MKQAHLWVNAKKLLKSHNATMRKLDSGSGKKVLLPLTKEQTKKLEKEL